MMFEVVCAFLTAVVLIVGIALHPTRVRCPTGWFAEGVRPSGSFQCSRPPPGGENDATTPPGRIGGRVWCTGGTVPVLADDGRTVGCMRYHGI